MKFKTPEYQTDGSFKDSDYEFDGDEKQGWSVKRNNRQHLRLGPGYRLLRTLNCGVCSTDLARQFLPYPLPQITGHEVVALENEKPVTVEINASHWALGQATDDCPICSNGLYTQCPSRITLGINQLPGGFSPYVLAPINAIVPVPESVSPIAASFTEPFAAALQGVNAVGPLEGSSVAVLGPRRLGMLVIAALSGYRNQTGKSFSITGIVRHENLEKACIALGADKVVHVDASPSFTRKFKSKFDVVFDTTGKPEGLELALHLAKKSVHLKSTNGQPVLGVNHLTDFVVDEQALLAVSETQSSSHDMIEKLNFRWANEVENRKIRNVYFSPSVPYSIIKKVESGDKNIRTHQMSVQEALETVTNKPGFLAGSTFPRFDAAVVSSAEEVDNIVRPKPGEEISLLRPRGPILFIETEGGTNSALLDTLRQKNLELTSSRCGDFREAMKILDANPHLGQAFEEHLVSHKMPLSNINEAFAIAGDSSQSLKVVIEAEG